MGIRRLLTGPVGPGSTFSVLAEAERAARQGRDFALVLPNEAAREHARNELARRMGFCDPTRVFTLASLARRLMGPRHTQRLASRRERDACLAEVLANLAEVRGRGEYELALRYRGFRAGLLQVFEEIEANGLRASALSRHLRGARLDEPRAARLLEAFRGYSDLLKQRKWLSEAGLLERATQALPRAREATPVPDLLLLDGFTDLSLRQIEFVNALALKAGETVVTWPVAAETSSTRAFAWPRRARGRLEQLGFTPEPRAEAADPRPPLLRRLADALFAAEPRALPSETPPAGLRVVRAASRRDEIEVALARAREYVTADPARRWTDVLVVVPDLQRYRPIIEQIGRELAVPVRVRGTMPLASAPLVQGALAFLRAVATFELAPLLVAAACPAFGLPPDEADRLAREARKRGLPARGDARLWVGLAGKLRGQAAAFLERALRLGNQLRELMEDAVFQDPQAWPTTQDGCRVIATTLERLIRPASLSLLGERPDAAAVARAAAEVAARRELLALLDDLTRLGFPLAPAGDPGEAAADRPSLVARLVARIEEEVRATRFRPVDRRRHVLHVVDAREARAWEAELVFVLGLVEREFPRAAPDDLFLPEAARRALTGRKARGQLQLWLKTAEDRAAEERFLYYAAATRARRQLWLLYPGFTASGTPRRPSRFLDATQELLGEELWGQVLEERTPGDLVSDEPELLLTPHALRRFAYKRVASVSRRAGPGTDQEARRVELAAALFGRLLGEHPERERATLALRRPHPWLPRPPGPAALEHTYSASELETYATCPFRHFVRYQLNARRSDDLAFSGLDALRQGNVVHKALQRIYADGEDPARALAEEFARGARELDIGLEEETFRRTAFEAILAFVREDDPAFRAATGLAPHAHELPFGPDEAAGPLEIEAPDLGGTIRLQGKIDRIDVGRPDAEGRRWGFVTDYKLGGREVDGNYLDGMYKGERLQIPVYLLALTRVLGLRPLGAGFCALGTRKRSGVVDPAVGATWEPQLDPKRVRLQRIPLESTLQRAEASIRRAVAGIAHGMIEALPREESDCSRCDAKDVCRLEPWEARRRARRGRPLPVQPMHNGSPSR